MDSIPLWNVRGASLIASEPLFLETFEQEECDDDSLDEEVMSFCVAKWPKSNVDLRRPADDDGGSGDDPDPDLFDVCEHVVIVEKVFISIVSVILILAFSK